MIASVDRSEATSPPNVVLFLVDDLGWQDVSVPMGPRATVWNRTYRTPWLDRLASEGIVFTDAYAASPVCTPTRASIMTGQHPARTGITYWILHAERDTSSRHERLDPPEWRRIGLSVDETTLPRLLSQEGYRTIHVGKAHFGAIDTPGADPRNLGFDVNIAGHAAGAPGSYLGIHHFSAGRRRGEEGVSVWDVPGLEADHGSEVYLTEVLATRAVEEIRNSVEMDRRFFLQFAPYAVHTPIMANPRFSGNYPNLDPREAAYASMIETVDAALGNIMTAIDRLGIADETAIIFASDNGGLSAHGRGGEPHTHNTPLRSGKGSAYEGGTRIPFVVRPPGGRSPHTDARTSSLVTTTDLFATVLDLARVPAERTPNDIDSVSICPAWGDAHATNPRRSIMWHMPHQWGVRGPGIEPFSAIREGSWKLIYFHDGPRIELYDLAQDLGETKNLAATRKEIVRRLGDQLNARLHETGANLSIVRSSGRPVELPSPGPTGEAHGASTPSPD